MPATALAPLTARQAALLQFILDQTLEHGYQPSMLEICTHFGWSTNNAVAVHLRALAARGYVGDAHSREGPGGGGKSRSVRFLYLPDGTPFRGFSLK